MHFPLPRARRAALKPRLFFFVTLLTAAGLVACGGGARSKGPERRYDLKGRVVSVDRAAKRVVVNHEPVPGLMGAMEMAFVMKDEAALQYAAPGDRIQTTLVMDDDGAWLENAVISRDAPGGAGAGADDGGPPPGAEVPNVQLVNQDGKTVRPGDYRGRALLLTFIYTRCPLPEFCDLMSTNFAAVNREVATDEALRARVRLLSVSVDPAHDTPKVLRSYGAAHTEKYSDEKFETWEFATGDPAEVRRLAQFFGLTYKEENDQIVHSLRTAVVGPDGRVYKTYRGNEWKPAEILADLRALLASRQ